MHNCKSPKGFNVILMNEAVGYQDRLKPQFQQCSIAGAKIMMHNCKSPKGFNVILMNDAIGHQDRLRPQL